MFQRYVLLQCTYVEFYAKERKVSFFEKFTWGDTCNYLDTILVGFSGVHFNMKRLS